MTDQLQRLDKMLLTQERLNRETQETVLSARMVPIKTQVSRLQRSVRQTCRLTGKQAQLHVSGADTLMDGEVLNELIDPLMHVLRNAVDHGIESPAQRSAAGKPEEGNHLAGLHARGQQHPGALPRRRSRIRLCGDPPRCGKPGAGGAGPGGIGGRAQEPDADAELLHPLRR